MASPDPTALLLGVPTLLFSGWLWRHTRKVRKQRDAALQRGGSASAYRAKLLLLNLNWSTGVVLGLVLCATGALGALRSYRESKRAERLRELVATCTDRSLTLENQSDEQLAATLSDIREGVVMLNDDSGMKRVLDGDVKVTLPPRARQELTWPAPEPAFLVAVVSTPERTVSAHVTVRDQRGDEVTSGSIFCSPH